MMKYVLKQENGSYVFKNDNGLFYGTKFISCAEKFTKKNAEKINETLFNNKCKIEGVK